MRKLICILAALCMLCAFAQAESPEPWQNWTIDERIADGYYYSRTVKLLKTLLENPELLDRPLNEEVEY